MAGPQCLARESRARGLLGVHLRQLDSNCPIHQSVESNHARPGVIGVHIGVHAPEFEFGKGAENIDRGICNHGLTNPIAIENDFVTWRAFGNDAWPAKLLFDDRGRLVRRWVGEGSDDEIEGEIRRLLTAITST